MSNRKAHELTEYSPFFLQPTNASHRQYEALRAHFVDNVSSQEAAKRFGYTAGSFRVLCHQFRQDPQRPFFLPTMKDRKQPPKKDQTRQRIIDLRKQNLSIYDISETLRSENISISPAMIGVILKEEGFARLPRRRDEERPPGTRPEVAPVADAREFDLSPRRFRTQFGGLFLFLPYLASLPFDRIMGQADLPGTKMIPAGHAIRSLLALKLFGSARHTHFMSHVFDEGLGVFAGLNVIPKRSFLTEYSCRINPASYPKLMKHWFDNVAKLGLERGVSFDLDFHTIPFHGEDALIQKHYVSKRSRRQKGVLAFVVQDADKRMFCYANAQIRKENQNDEILRFVDFWKQRTGKLPGELVFDSKLTTYANLSHLNRMNIPFITLRRRTSKILQNLHEEPLSAWRRIELKGLSRIYRTPRVLDQTIHLDDYDGPVRQLTVTDLGHEEPTLLLTNQLRISPATLITRYAQRMLIENNIADGIDFFHMDALSSAVAMKVNCDLQLTLMASSLYRLLGSKLGNGYRTAKSRHIFRDFIDAAATIQVEPGELLVRFQKRAHNPLLIASGFADMNVPIPWIGGKKLRFLFG